MFLRKSLGLALITAVFVPVVSIAQDDEDTDAFYFADTVRVEGLRTLRIPTLNAVATKMVLPLHSTPASVGVVTRAIFESQNGMILSDALKNISGVNVQHGSGTHDFFLIRGFESLSGGLVLTDGAPEPEVSFYNLYNIERVEVLKGPAAFLYGSNPLSGAANLVRKQPVFGNFARFSGSVGEFQTYRGTFDLGFQTPASNLAFRVNGFWQDSENYRDDKEQSTVAVNPAVTWKIDERSSVTANFEYVRSNAEPDAGLPLQFVPDASFNLTPTLPRVPRKRSFQTPLDDSEQDLFRLRLDYRRQLSQSVTLKDKVYFTQLDWVSTGALMNGAFPDPSRPGEFNVIRTLNSLDDSQKFFGNQLEAIFSFSTGSVRHHLVTGLETARLTDDFKLDLAPFIPPSETDPAGLNLALAIDLNHPVEFTQGRNQLTFLPFAAGDARSLIFAPYFINQASFSDQVQLFFGGRLDIIDYEDQRADLNFQTFQPVASDNTRNYEKFSPMVGLVVKPVAALSFYANAGQSFSAPSTLVVGDPRPEESTQFELGAKLHALGGRLTSTVSVYHLERENIGIADETGVTQQTGDQRSRGLEFEIAVQPLQGWNAFLNYAFTDAELTEFREVNPRTRQIMDFSGNTPGFAPEHIINFWTTKDFNKTIGIGAGFRYVSEQFIDEDNAFEIDDYLTFDGSLYYTFGNIRWSLNIKNITDKDYLRRGGFGSASVTPGNPRAVYGAVNFSL
ncbi:MAG: TonB-dependent receptor [bacterium]